MAERVWERLFSAKREKQQVSLLAIYLHSFMPFRSNVVLDKKNFYHAPNNPKEFWQHANHMYLLFVVLFKLYLWEMVEGRFALLI